MRLKQCLVVLSVFGMSCGCLLAAGPMGPPAATLGQGQIAVGLDYAYGDFALDLPRGRDSTGARMSGFEVDPFTLQTLYANMGYGIFEQWEVGAKVGSAWGEWDRRSNQFEGEAGPLVGGYTRATFFRHNQFEFGGLFHVDWLHTEGDNRGPGWAGDTEVEFVHLRAAIGPRYTCCERFAIYGGPFVQYIDGEKRYEERRPTRGYREEYDVEADSLVGGFIGAEAILSENVRLGVDFQMTAQDWMVGGSFRWLW